MPSAQPAARIVPPVYIPVYTTNPALPRCGTFVGDGLTHAAYAGAVRGVSPPQFLYNLVFMSDICLKTLVFGNQWKCEFVDTFNRLPSAHAWAATCVQGTLLLCTI